MLQIAAILELSVCWLLWGLAFAKPRKLSTGQKKVVSAPASRWGIGLEVVAFALTWMYVRPEGFEKSTASLVISMILFPPSVILVWMATRHLGKQWRYEAALSEDHELIKTGPYAIVRHPIYTSMLCMLLATGAAWTWWPLFVAGVIFFLAGNEIRVRAEDRLLGERFGPSFEAYRSSVPAYIPFIR